MNQVDGPPLAFPERQEEEHDREQAEDDPEASTPPDGRDRERSGQARGIDGQDDRLEVDGAGIARRMLLQPEGAQVTLAQLGPERRRGMEQRLRAISHTQVELELGEKTGGILQDVETPGRPSRDIRNQSETDPPPVDTRAIPRQDQQQAEKIDDSQRMAQSGGDDR